MEIKLFWTKKAQTDLSHIRKYSLMHFEQDITKDIVNCCNKLIIYPQIGVKTKYNSEIRLLRHKKWNIFYAVREKSVVIQTVMAQMQDSY